MQRQIHLGFCWLTVMAALFNCLPTTSWAHNRPTTFDDFEVVGFANDPENDEILILDSATINKINCGCADCSPGMCTQPDDTYLYFPAYQNTAGSAKPYWMTAGEIQIDRTTSLFLAGADSLRTKYLIRNEDLDAAGPAAPIFTIVAAPLVNFSNMMFWPDPGYRESNLYPDGPVAIRFANTTPIDVELLNLRFEGGKVNLDGPGNYRLQHVVAQTLGSFDTFIDIDHPGADVTIVGGLFASGGAYHPGSTSRIVTTCSTTDQAPPGAPAECACGMDGCDSTELSVLEALCAGPDAPQGCPYNPCGCDNHFVWQRKGHVQLFSTALISVNGQADMRFDSAAATPHAVVSVRSEGTKCTTGYPSTHVLVPPTSEAIDIIMASNVGAWGPHSLSRIECPEADEQIGSGHFVNYNGEGTVWLVGNNGVSGAGTLAVGAAPNATIMAVGNRFFGNKDQGGSDPLNFLPLNEGTCATAGTACYAGDPDACPGDDICVAQPINKITVGNTWSRGLFCDWCSRQTDPDLCDDLCSGWSVGDDRFEDPQDAFTDYSSAPQLPELAVPLPISLPPVNSPLDRMVDARTECRDNECTGYYPNDCCSDTGCNYSRTDPVCWIQAGLYKGLAEGNPVYIAEGNYTIPRPLYWVHTAQEDQGIPLPDGYNYPGGWIVGQNNNVTITNSNPEAVFTTEGMSNAVIQGITFATAPYSGSEMHSTMDIENNRLTCGQDPDLRCGNSNDCNVCDGGFCLSNQSQECTTSADCTDTCNQEYICRQTANIGFYDCNFEGGRHALGLCMNSPTQCDTIMTVNGTFSNAHIGWATGGWNTLRNIAYNATLLDNEIAMGHDDVVDSAGQGSWSALHASISSNISGARDINLHGGIRTFYFHGVNSYNATVLDETAAQNRDYFIMFDHSNLNKGNPPLSTPMIDYSQSNGPMFIYSDLGEGWIRLSDVGLSTKGRAAWKINSKALGWPENVLADEDPDANPSQTSKFFELEFCREAVSCHPCAFSNSCTQKDTGDTQCLDPATQSWTISSCGKTLVYDECTCRPKKKTTCPQLVGDDGIYDPCP